MDLMPAPHTTQPSSTARVLGGAGRSAYPAYLGASRGVSTPPPQRPRLFTCASVARRSPPPPARLEPIPSSTLCSPVQQQHTLKNTLDSSAANGFNDAKGDVPGAGAAACGEPGSARPPLDVSLLAYEGLLPRVGRGIFTACEANLESALLPAHAHPPLPQKVGLAGPPHALAANSYSEAIAADGSGSSAAGVIESPSTLRSAAGVPCIQAVGSGKRHRMISSTDTQHSSASSELAPPRTRGAFSYGSVTVESAALHDAAVDAPVTHPLLASVTHQVAEDHKLEANDALQRCLTRGSHSTVGCSASFIHTGDAGASIKLDAATPLAGQHALSDEVADAQCLIFEESVDTATVLTPAELQPMRSEAALGHVYQRAADDSPTPYQRRVVTADVLRDWTGWEDLQLVLTAELRVDADTMIGVDQIGTHLPSVVSLKLHNSRIPRVRQLGTGYHALKYLWLNRCHLSDLHGIAACCPSLVDLYLPFNHVRDVAPVMALAATLEVLDLEGNLLEDAAELGDVLSSLHGVRALSLLGNPLTCHHQARVRQAYRDLLAEEGLRASASTGASDTVPSSVPPQMEHMPFSPVLAAWVRLLMPQLQTLNDVPVDVAVSSSCTASPLHGPLTGEVSRPLAAPTPAHVDPLDDALAEELRLVEACVRGTDVFDPLLAAVEAANQHIYTRPSTSRSGAQRRLVPTTAMGVARPFTSLWAKAPVRLGSSATSTSDASTLTTGAVLAGNATAGLRRRLASPSTPPFDAAQKGLSGTAAVAAVGPTEGADTSAPLSGICGSDSQDGAAFPADLGEDPRIAALLANDSEEEEWEHFKASLLRCQSTESASVPRLGASTNTMAAASSDHALPHTENGEFPSAANALQADGFDKVLRAELTRLRMRIAKESR
ncbi:hypothetical protein LSCM1_06242 [Leishmania martiniquensis]|uniref:Leucine-rich repeat protein n=1 Tax=Leishmania martiniquensis TaxID=1580590 RepID=A0A836HPW3_9TRYP|nr:hypothetical protein LSCM1_06242 [Leishmania martiniquensis]